MGGLGRVQRWTGAFPREQRGELARAVVRARPKGSAKWQGPSQPLVPPRHLGRELSAKQSKQDWAPQAALRPLCYHTSPTPLGAGQFQAGTDFS